MTWESQVQVLFRNGCVESQVDRLLDDAIRAASEWSESIPEGIFSCSFKLPAYVGQEKSTASYRHGVLTITFPRHEESKASSHYDRAPANGVGRRVHVHG